MEHIIDSSTRITPRKKPLAEAKVSGPVYPEWVELRVPSDLTVISPLQELVTQLEVGLSPEVREAITRAFREMLCNAIEYGGISIRRLWLRSGSCASSMHSFVG